MRIEYVRVQNYRNLDDVTLYLDPTISYLLGENNIGKSNFVAALDMVLSGGMIRDTDYGNYRKPLSVELHLLAQPGEADAVGAGDDGRIAILCTKDIADVKVNCINMETGKSIPGSFLRRINYFRDEVTGTLNARSERNLRVDSLLLHMLRQLSAQQETNEQTKWGELLQALADQFERVKRLADIGLETDVEPDTAASLAHFLVMLDDTLRPQAAQGNGIRYAVIAMMNVINRILMLFNSRSTPLLRMVYQNSEGRRILPMVMALDEPEAHLHPYMQRSLIRYYKRIMSNQDATFLRLLQGCFGIDGLDGQLLIITHSADALVDNFRNLVRFYKDSHGRTRTACGPTMKVNADIEKHLLMQFPDIKEAFYGRCALLVEGVSESTSLRAMAETIGTPLDDYGITVIDAGGEGSLRKLKSLLSRFGIPCVLVFDGDVRHDERTAPNEFYTVTPCFETEIVAALVSIHAYDMLDAIVTQLDPKALSSKLSYAYLDKPLQKFGSDRIRIPRTLGALKRNGSEQYQTIYAAWLYKNKGAILGRIIGAMLPSDGIPSCYRDAILRAKALSVASDRA